VKEELIQYTFFGKVFPERANVKIQTMELSLVSAEAGISGKLRISIQVSQIIAIFTTSSKVENIYTLKNIIEDGIRLEVDVLGYIFGCGYDIEVTTMVDSEGNEPIIFGVGIWELEQQKDKRLENINKIFSLFGDHKGDYLRRCLGDIREAIRLPKDTGFFCYRAIETIRQFFVHEKGFTSDKESWEQLRELLKIERTFIEYIKQFADSIRHGDVKYISAEQRSKVLTDTWDIVDRFIAYASNGYNELL